MNKIIHIVKIMNIPIQSDICFHHESYGLSGGVFKQISTARVLLYVIKSI